MAEEQRLGRVWATFTIVAVTCALGSLTQTVMNSMLLGVQASFGTPESVSQWLTTIYMLTVGITVPLVTHLSNKLDIRALTLLALGLFLVGAFVDFFAPNFLVLILGRIPQGASAGVTLPLLQTIAMTRFPRHMHGTSMGIAGIAMGFAPNIGPLIGGALVDTLGWRSFYLILAVVLVVLVVLTLVVIKREDAPARDAHLDWLSFILSTVGFGGLLLGFTNAANMALTDLLVILPLVVGVICLFAFVIRQKRIQNPLIDMGIFKNSNYTISFVAIDLLFGSFMGITLIVPLFVQGVLGMTALDAGIVFIPATIMAVIFNPLSGILMDRIGVRPVVLVGAAFLTVGAISMVFVDSTTPLWLLTVMQTVRGIGVSTLIGPLSSWGLSGLSGVSHALTMSGSAFVATVRQACASFGTALMMLAVSLAAITANTSTLVLGYQIAFGFSAVLAVGVLILSIAKVK